MDKDFSDLLSLFDRFGVKYLIVGGFAVIFYTQPRGTKDLDLYIDNERSNVEAAYRALVEFGAPLSGYSVDDLQDPTSVFQIGQPPLRIDILKQVTGVEFTEAWKNRTSADLDGLNVLYIGQADLIRNKLAVARMQDLADVEAIQMAMRSLEPPTTGTNQ